MSNTAKNQAKQLGREPIDGDGVVSASSKIYHSQPGVTLQACEL